MSLLELRGIRKSFGAVVALDGVDLTLNAGEVLALVGDNGAGKSTLIKCLSDVHAIDGGTMLLDGKPLPRGAIETVYQDLALCDPLDVVANLFLGREEARAGFLDEIRMEQRAVESLRSLGVTLPDVRVEVGALSGGQRQAIAVARAVMWSSRIVVLDEPTAALGVTQTAQVLELVRTLRAKGLGVILISHNLADVFAVADRILVLRQGRKAAELDVKSTTPGHVVAAITGAAR